MVALGGISTDITDLKESHDALRAKQELLRNLIDVQEVEKRFLCHEFHDGLIQYAVGALLLLEAYQRNHPSTEDSAKIDTAIVKLRQGVEDGRRVIRGIRPAVLDDSNVEAAIQDLIGQFSNSEIMVTCNCDPQIGRLPESVQTTIYRVVQEALNNARKYSGTDVVRIELRKSDGNLHLEVRDFGCGFDVESARRQGFGLLGMVERVRLLGGDCSIKSEKDAGTTITARLPIPAPEADGK
jgi:signal transduction histidine kinase